MLGGLLANGGDVPDIIYKKVNTPEVREWSLGLYTAQEAKEIKSSNPILQKAYNDFLEKFSGKTKEEIKGALGGENRDI